jgi:hypothetical protein
VGALSGGSKDMRRKVEKGHIIQGVIKSEKKVQASSIQASSSSSQKYQGIVT